MLFELRGNTRARNGSTGISMTLAVALPNKGDNTPGSEDGEASASKESVKIEATPSYTA